MKPMNETKLTYFFDKCHFFQDTLHLISNHNTYMYVCTSLVSELCNFQKNYRITKYAFQVNFGNLELWSDHLY